MTTGAAALIQKGARLKKLSLFANQLGDEGASEIADALSAGSFVHLQELDVSANSIGSQGVQRLFDVLESQAAPALEVWTVTELHAQGFVNPSDNASQTIMHLPVHPHVE